MNLIVVMFEDDRIPEWVLNRCNQVLRLSKERAVVLCHGEKYDVLPFCACRGYAPSKIIWTFDLHMLDHDGEILRMYLERFKPIVEYWSE